MTPPPSRAIESRRGASQGRGECLLKGQFTLRSVPGLCHRRHPLACELDLDACPLEPPTTPDTSAPAPPFCGTGDLTLQCWPGTGLRAIVPMSTAPACSKQLS